MEFNKIVPLSLIFISFLALIVESKDEAIVPYIVKGKGLKCIGNPTYIVNMTCKLKPLSWDKSVGNIMIYLIPTVSNASIRIELYKYTNQYRPFFMNVTFNICKVLDKRLHVDPYSMVLIKTLAKYSSINHPCPYSGWIKAEGIYLNPAIANYNMPFGTYKIVFTFFEEFTYKSEHVVTIMYVMAVVDKENARPPTKA